jgi:hypothetical protein
MFSNVQFERVGNQWCGVVSPDALADTLIDMDILKSRGVYAGSYVLQLIHGESYDNSDVDVYCEYNGNGQPQFCNRYNEQFWKIFAICKAKHHLITRAFSTKPDEYDTNMVGIAGLSEYRTINGTKIQIIACRYDPVLNLQSRFDFDLCASRIYMINNVIYVMVPCTDDNVFNKRITIGTNKIVKSSRIQKYESRGYSFVDNQNWCGICHDSSDPAVHFVTACGHWFHIDCLATWTRYSQGDEIIAAKSQCPCCKRDLPECNHVYTTADNSLEYLTILNVSNYNFDTHIYCACLTCAGFRVFSEPRTNICSDIVPPRMVMCETCRDPLGIVSRLQNMVISCPSCSMQLQHAGGCTQFACCSYGREACHEGCTHGSTEFVQFCGHKWVIDI